MATLLWLFIVYIFRNLKFRQCEFVVGFRTRDGVVSRAAFSHMVVHSSCLTVYCPTNEWTHYFVALWLFMLSEGHHFHISRKLIVNAVLFKGGSGACATKLLRSPVVVSWCGGWGRWSLRDGSDCLAALVPPNYGCTVNPNAFFVLQDEWLITTMPSHNGTKTPVSKRRSAFNLPPQSLKKRIEAKPGLEPLR